ncbi:MFS transporter [Corynebacterium aquilae]|uniref:Lysosomal dipeptide transporter MFSD1 n=1 Tax=Corynebacterium aquilae DSM 44791 TaxID=1431546 RepID=A0A1L7CHC1_9CORY|nr:MFS transporter [Corynebacterium aquilae]APT85143.1 MFS transporter permease [Corynebacterium aquilae DSM 44791]
MTSATSSPAVERISTRAIVVWLAATGAYVMAILGRTSMGVAGVQAMDHFHIDASRLAVFTSVQVGVYALAQIPMGMAIDLFQPRRMLVAGAIIMAAGQLILGLTSSYPVAILGRVLVGTGDASAFLSVMRLLPAWFPLRKTPLFSQLTASLGQIGQFLSAVPFLAYLEHSGWRHAFVAIGALGVLVAAACAVVVRDSPDDSPRHAHASTATSLRQRLRTVVREPVCWEGFFTHYVGLMPNLVFALLWGLPMMTLGQGLTTAQAGSIFVIGTVINVAVSPLHGILSSRFGSRRYRLTIAMNLAYFVGLGWFFSSAEPRGYGAILVAAGVGFAVVPSSNFGFDSVRESLDHRVLAAGTGLANMGGFVATMIAGQLMGVVLDSQCSDGSYTWSCFGAAWWSVFAVWLAGVVALVIIARRQRRTRLHVQFAD